MSKHENKVIVSNKVYICINNNMKYLQSVSYFFIYLLYYLFVEIKKDFDIKRYIFVNDFIIVLSNDLYYDKQSRLNFFFSTEQTIYFYFVSFI